MASFSFFTIIALKSITMATTHKRKKNLIVSYKNLTDDLKELFKEAYPDGYSNYITKFTKPNGEPIFVVPFETDDTAYMVKFDVKIDTLGEDLDKALFDDDSDDAKDDEFAPLSEALEKEEENTSHRERHLRHGDFEDILDEDKKKKATLGIDKEGLKEALGDDSDDEEIDRILDNTKGARHTFVMTHGPVLPPDITSCRWFFHGGASEANTQARLHFRQAFARRNAIVLCGHTHYTDFMDWEGDGGRITQMTMSSVWTSDKQKEYTVRSEGAENYGMFRKKLMEKPDGAKLKDESALFDEYRPGVRQHINSTSQGSYKLNISDKLITIDFYAGDSQELSHKFVIR